jgi:hypothetical protein
MTACPSPRFGMSDCYDVYFKLKADLESLEAARGEDEQSQKRQDYAAFNFFITARHLAHDWLPKNAGRSKDSLKKLRRKHAGITAALKAAQDIANGSKHFILKYNPTTSIEDRSIFDYEGYFYGAQYGVKEANYYFSMSGLARILMGYFDWIFDDKASVYAFPSELIEQVDYSRVAPKKPAK